MRSDLVTVVVPTYNERDNLPHLAAAIRLHGYRLLVVDDASPDGTGTVADAIAAPDPLMDVLHRRSKEGLGPAYAAGFDQVLAGPSEVVIEMDGDFSHNPADLPRLVAAVEVDGADLAIGSRYVAGGATPDWPAHRRFLSRGGNRYVRLMLGIPIRDATAGFRAFRSEALRALPYRAAQASGYGFQVEMAMRAHDAGMRVAEIPVVFRDRTVGTSKMNGAIVREAMWLVTRWGVTRRLGRAPAAAA
ncbi:MAG: polyprenol monophosphomannose synthase [Acidimicrobiia bacterium]